MAQADNQPLDLVAAEILTSGWLSPRVELSAQAGVTTLRSDSELSGVIARAGGKLRTGAATVDLHASIAGRSWSDRRLLVLGGAGGELFPSGALRVQAGARRDEEISMPAAVVLHVLKDTGHVGASVHEVSGINAVARVEVSSYSDGNIGLLTYAWLTYALLDSPLRADVGYSGAYRDTRESRWDSVRSAYFPYTAPLKSFRHGPVVALALTFWKLRAGASVSMALQASETDPTTFRWYESRRDTSYVEGRGFARIEGRDAGLEASYEQLRDGYYVSHTAKLSSHVPF